VLQKVTGECERGMIVGVRNAGCSILQTDLGIFQNRRLSGLPWYESHKTFWGRLVGDSGKRMMEKVVEANIQATTDEIQALYNSSGPEKPISLRTTWRTNKTLEECKSYLRENYICYRCCGSTQHMARDCKMTVKCLECNSDKHIAALHPGPSLATTQSTVDDRGESPPSSVTSKCTEICGNADSARSCSKICLVKAYPEGRKEKTKCMRC
uniref:CCHC-type domain-containing protein n=1 Tax=Cynoglossus semilaevis TaxID=244447 RepID=A0A3P8VRI0_CYNSE